MAIFTNQLTILKCVGSSLISRNSNVQLFSYVRAYSRWAHRKPVKIVNEKEVFGDSYEPPQDILKDATFAFARRQKLAMIAANKAKAKELDDKKGTLNDDGTFIFTKLAKDDPRISTLMMTVRSRQKQKKEDKILLEGYRLIEDAMKIGLMPEIILFSRTPDLQRLPLPKEGIKLYKIPYRTMQLWSDLSTSPGVMGIFKTPDTSISKPADDSIPVTIICDNVREPGNLGAILRVAAGVGCEQVILTKGCVDMWSPKVLRSAAGAHFRLPIYKSQSWPEIQYLISEDAKVYIADNNVLSPMDPSKEPAESSESDSSSDSESGSDSEPELDDETQQVIDKIRKDFDGRPESSDGEKTPKRAANSASGREVGLYGPLRKSNSKNSEVDTLPVIPYFSTCYTANETILIVGGETEGISQESVSLTSRRGGIRINVPLTNGVDSLNTGTALGVLLFEIKRQFLIGSDDS
ncbi:rRNA methyltransferase 3, mitochondrial [Athalia rosae]|uniref:rRNA methyltransferase 3, mitochondrial n=1 Tax=Athalia rosae TaxID=37344 RepID=UPI002033E42E|nr:rRNA methyltransferase 3, mitochondrial [Athalia rosae]